MMENQKLHFSSPRQTNDIIVYHSRAKSSQISPNLVQPDTKTSISDLTKDYLKAQQKNLQHDRAPHSARSIHDPQTNRNTIKVQSQCVSPRTVGVDKSPGMKSNRAGMGLYDEPELRRTAELEKQNKELQKLLKLRDLRIGELLRENDAFQKKIDTQRNLEHINTQLNGEVGDLRSELGVIVKRFQELELENTQLLTLKKEFPTTSGGEDINSGLLKYAKYIMNYINSTDDNNFAHFCFEERFSSEKSLYNLINKKDHGMIALQAFRYISDLLGHVSMPALPHREGHAKLNWLSIEPKENLLITSEPSSICFSPLRVDSRDNTPHDLIRDLDTVNKGITLKGFDKVHQIQQKDTLKVPLSAGVGKFSTEKERTKKQTNIRDTKQQQQPLSARLRTDSSSSSLKTASKNHINSATAIYQKDPLQVNTKKAKKSTYSQLRAKVDPVVENKAGQTFEKEIGLLGKNYATLKKELQFSRNGFDSDRGGVSSATLSRKNEGRRQETDIIIKESSRGALRDDSQGTVLRVDTRDYEKYTGQSGEANKPIYDEYLSKTREGEDIDSGRRSPVVIRSILKQGSRLYDNDDRAKVLKEEGVKKTEHREVLRHVSPRDKRGDTSHESKLRDRILAEAYKELRKPPRDFEEPIKERSSGGLDLKKNLENGRNEKRSKYHDASIETIALEESGKASHTCKRPFGDGMHSTSNDKPNSLITMLNKNDPKSAKGSLTTINPQNMTDSSIYRGNMDNSPFSRSIVQAMDNKDGHRGSFYSSRRSSFGPDESASPREKKTERFVTFDGTDAQIIFNTNDRDLMQIAGKKPSSKVLADSTDLEYVLFKDTTEKFSNDKNVKIINDFDGVRRQPEDLIKTYDFSSKPFELYNADDGKGDGFGYKGSLSNRNRTSMPDFPRVALDTL